MSSHGDLGGVGGVFEERRQNYLNTSLRSQQSSQLTEMGQSRD